MDFPKSTQELLEKYWAAETTPEEEATLRKLLKDSKDSVFGTYFNYLSEESLKEMPAPVTQLKGARVMSIRRAFSIAAAVLILVTAGFIIQRNMTADIRQAATADSFENPEQAYQEAKQALILVSEKMNKSRKKAGEQLAKTQPYVDIIK